MARFAPETRPMDAVKVSMDAPQEEDLAVANTCALSAVYALSFPQHAQSFFDRYFFLRGIPARDRERWETVYLEVVRKATLAAGGRRMVLKSPANTGRMPHLLRLFPGARFLHVVRSPYVIYESLVHLFRSVVPMHQLQPVSDEALEDLALFVMRETMAQYLRDRASVPRGQLAELRFEHLERSPVTELESVYASLDLPGWRQAQGAVETYLSGLSGYRKNRYAWDAGAIERVERECGFALDVWEYPRPVPE